MTRLMLPTAFLIGALALVACGKVGTLDQPAPLYGEKAKADYQARKAAEAAARAANKDSDEPEVLPDRVYDPNADPSPQRYLPIPGTNPAPNAPPPPGVLPDPFNNPG
jgi:cell division septation protein DedD